MKKDPDSKPEKAEMELVRNANGSHSIRDLSCGQTMHSRIGPEVEAKFVYADSARLSRRLAENPSKALVLWDVGLGTGSNVTATLTEIRDAREADPDRFATGCELRIQSFENAPQGLALAVEAIDCFPVLQPWETPLKELLSWGKATFSIGPIAIHWSLHAGEFYENLTSVERPDLIYFDFYSPKAHPDLWTRERFRQIRDRIGDRDAELYTYSAATPTRLALLRAGFFVGYGERTSEKTETTVAATRYELLRRPLGTEWIRKLEVSSSVTDESAREEARRHPQWGQRSSG